MADPEEGKLDLETTIERETTPQKPDWTQWIPVYGAGRAMATMREGKPSLFVNDYVHGLNNTPAILHFNHYGLFYHALTTSTIVCGALSAAMYELAQLFN